MLDEGPFDDGHGGEDGVVKEFVDDVDADAWLVLPVLHHRGDDLAARLFGLGFESEQAIFAALNAGEHV